MVPLWGRLFFIGGNIADLYTVAVISYHNLHEEMSIMIHARYTFSCRFDKTASLPAFKGSLIRGMLGSSLRQTACALRRNNCDSCLLISRCVYAKAFETITPKYHQTKKTPPHPYVLQPPLSEQREYQEGEGFEVSLLLFGEMTDYLPYFVYAFERMGESGLGSNTEQGPSPFTLLHVSRNGTSIYDHKSKTLDLSLKPEPLELSPAGPDNGVGELHLELITPLRIKHLNSFAKSLPFHVLVRAMLRRISTMFAHYGGGEPKLDYRGLVQRAQDVTFHSDRTRWKDWTRYSTRQKQVMQFGGLVGEITYGGRVAEFIPLFELCKTLHVGKQSVFGLGQIDFALEQD
jgi:hypothetical protein